MLNVDRDARPQSEVYPNTTTATYNVDAADRAVEITKSPFPRRRAVYGFIDRQDLPAQTILSGGEAFQLGGDNIGLVITNRQSGKRVFYAPGLGALEPHVLAAMREADLLLIDGTLWPHIAATTTANTVLIKLVPMLGFTE